MMTWQRQSALFCLIGFSGVAAFFFLGATNPNPEGKLICAAFGGTAVVFLMPFWTLYCRSNYRWLFTLLTLAAVWFVILVNCSAAESAGTRWTHPSDYGFVWLCLVPGFFYNFARVFWERNQF